MLMALVIAIAIVSVEKIDIRNLLISRLEGNKHGTAVLMFDV
jgi:hypothetical protein